jgi:two-component system, OmpR family, sensor histidine kinase TctE
MHSSLQRQLLAWVLLPVAAAVAVDARLTYESSVETASIVQDRLLLGSARMIAQQISFEDGTFQHQIPPAALELFQSELPDRIFYRVTTGTGQLLSGYTDLPLPARQSPSASPHFFGATMRGEPVRVVAFFQSVVGNPSALPVVVEIAQTALAHDQLSKKLWLSAVAQQLLILALTTIFILFGLHQGLRPLIRLRDDVRARKEGSLQPLQTDRIPAELTPLVDSFNDYIQRLENHTNLRSSFIQNAAHQLRTPLAVLNTQISDAMRAPGKAEAEVPLLAARRTLQQTTRLVNQFLTLSAAEAYVAVMMPTTTQSCCDVVQKVLEDMAFQAHQKQIDLGFERTGVDTLVSIDPAALREITVNLIDNAVRYTQVGGVVTVRVESSAEKVSLAVEDNGPGVAEHNRSRLFERFYRAGETGTAGSGLGLAIVKELVSQCAGTVQVQTPEHGGTGLLLRIAFFANNRGAANPAAA